MHFNLLFRMGTHMKRYIGTTADSVSNAKSKFYKRADHISSMQGVGRQIESMLDDELQQYFELHPEYADDWYDDEAGCKIIPPSEDRFYPSNELKQFARDNGFILARATSKQVPDYDWYVKPAN